MAESSLPPWLAPPFDQFNAMRQAKRVPHALLLSGPAGWGVEWLASRIALALLDLPAEQDVIELAHPDFRRVRPDGAVIKVAEVRALSEFAVGTRQLAPAKVAWIQEAHSLNAQAANALLKTLEEPTADTYLILETEYPGRLLATIRSRCQSVRVAADRILAQRWLSATLGDDAELGELLFEFGGAPLAVLAAHEGALQPLRAPLQRALSERRGDAALDELLAAPVEHVGLRWLRYLSASIARRPQGFALLEPVSAQVLVAFQQELLAFHRAALSSNSVNVPLQLERLAHRFSQLPVDL